MSEKDRRLIAIGFIALGVIMFIGSIGGLIILTAPWK